MTELTSRYQVEYSTEDGIRKYAQKYDVENLNYIAGMLYCNCIHESSHSII